MRKLLQILLTIAITGIFACGGSDDSASTQDATDTTEVTSERGLAPADYSAAMPECPIEGEVLDGNKFWARSEQVLIAIAADSSTYDEGFDMMSHRILKVYNATDCSLIEQHTLPVDVSPDFAYYLAEITYNNINKIVAIRGATSIYCYNIDNKKLLPKLEPQFRSERYAVDAQSGQIQRLEVWEKYLIGYAQDHGVFVFDFTDKQNPKAQLPFAEYAVDETRFAPLFLLPSEQGGVQAIMPEYERATGEFAIHAAFDRPLELNTNVQRSARNNRYLVLRREDNNAPVAFDLQQHQRVELPSDIASQGTQNILQWMRSNVQ